MEYRSLLFKRRLCITFCVLRWALLDLNRRPKDYESFALTAELKALAVYMTTCDNLSAICNKFKGFLISKYNNAFHSFVTFLTHCNSVCHACDKLLFFLHASFILIRKFLFHGFSLPHRHYIFCLPLLCIHQARAAGQKQLHSRD